MSMALGLEFTAKWLREKNSWKPNECGVQPDCLPPNEAGMFYVGIDDAGVDSGPEETEDLVETLTLRIGIWRRSEHLSIKDRKHVLKLPIDSYIVGAYTLHDLERAVIVKRLNGLHGNWAYMQELNHYFDLPDVNLGDKFMKPFRYRGRGRMETVGNDLETGQVIAWFGYRLMFHGLTRVQSMSVGYAQG